MKENPEKEQPDNHGAADGVKAQSERIEPDDWDEQGRGLYAEPRGRQFGQIR